MHRKSLASRLLLAWVGGIGIASACVGQVGDTHPDAALSTGEAGTLGTGGTVGSAGTSGAAGTR